MKSVIIPSNTLNKGYQFWPGKHLFFCKGIIMVGYNYKRPIILFVIFLISECLFLYTNFAFFRAEYYAILISICLYIFICILQCKLLTRDPGYIPKQIPPFAMGPLNAPTLDRAMSKEAFKTCSINLPYLQVPYNSVMLKLKYCNTCIFYYRLNYKTIKNISLQ